MILTQIIVKNKLANMSKHRVLQKPKHSSRRCVLRVLSNDKTRVRVRQLDVELLSALHNRKALAGGNAVRNLSGIDAVLRKQHLKLLNVVDQDLAEAVR